MTSTDTPTPGVAGPTLFAAILCLAAASPAQAEGLELVLKHGDASGAYERSGIGLRFSSWWADDWGKWNVALHPEIELGRFRYNGSHPGPHSLNQGGVVGTLRMRYGEAGLRPYAELGLGAALLSRDRLGNKDFSTHYQFSQHVGLGVEFAERWSVGWQYSHYSNADIEKPNDGIDLHQIMLGVRF